MILFMNCQRISCFPGNNILKNNFRMYPSLHDSTWPQDRTLLGGTWNLSLAITCRPFVWHCVVMAEEASPLSGCICFWAEGMKYTLLLSVCTIICFQWSLSAFRDQDLHSHSLPQCKKQKSEEPKLTMCPGFFCVLYTWKCYEVTMFGNVFWCFTPKNKHK